MRPTHLERVAIRIIRTAGAARTLLGPIPVERDQHGYFFHSALPAQRGADSRLHWFAFANGFDVKSDVMADDELSIKARERYLGPASDFSGWTPKPPAGERWPSLAIYDSEEGPTAASVRETQSAECNSSREMPMSSYGGGQPTQRTITAAAGNATAVPCNCEYPVPYCPEQLGRVVGSVCFVLKRSCCLARRAQLSPRPRAGSAHHPLPGLRPPALLDTTSPGTP